MFSYFENQKFIQFLCFISQIQYRNEDQNFKSNTAFQFIKKTKWH